MTARTGICGKPRADGTACPNAAGCKIPHSPQAWRPGDPPPVVGIDPAVGGYGPGEDDASRRWSPEAFKVESAALAATGLRDLWNGRCRCDELKFCGRCELPGMSNNSFGAGVAMHRAAQRAVRGSARHRRLPYGFAPDAAACAWFDALHRQVFVEASARGYWAVIPHDTGSVAVFRDAATVDRYVAAWNTSADIHNMVPVDERPIWLKDDRPRVRARPAEDILRQADAHDSDDDASRGIFGRVFGYGLSGLALMWRPPAGEGSEGREVLEAALAACSEGAVTAADA